MQKKRRKNSFNRIITENEKSVSFRPYRTHKQQMHRHPCVNDFHIHKLNSVFTRKTRYNVWMRPC